MSVSSTHQEYDRQKPVWRRCRDVIAGRDALLRDAIHYSRVNVNGSLFSSYGTTSNYLYEEYIPRLSDQDDNDYYRYVERASFFNAAGRTVDALTGLLFAKAPTQTLPGALTEYAKDITMDGCSLREFASEIAREEITTSRVGILVDYPDVDTSGMTAAQAEAANLRPYMTMYKAEQIINWRCQLVNGVKQLTLVVLAEQQEIPKNEFESECVQRFRVLDLAEGVYRVRIMTDEGEVISESFPTMQGRTIDYLPFTIVSGNSIRKPLILDLVDTNIAHYRNSADYEHGLHFTGLPTPYVAGVQLGEGQSLQIGSTSAWIFPDPAAKAEYLEFKGSGLGTLLAAMKEKEQRMAVLGAKMLVEEKRMSEAVQTVELRTAGERSVLADVSFDISDAFNLCLKWMADWAGVSGEIRYQVNLDFGAHKMEPRMLSELMKAVQSDLMPMSVMFENLKKGEIVSGSMEFEDYENQLATQAPNLDISAPEQDTELMDNVRSRLGL